MKGSAGVATLGLTESERESIERFERDVIQPSMTALIILDFWADWCGPCKQLSPVLEKVASEYAPRGVKLVKIDIEQDKLLAAQFRIQSIPTVYALFEGRPVADLTNHRTEGQLKRALDQLLSQLNVPAEGTPPQAEVAPLIAMGEQVLADGDPQRAANIFRQLHDMAPDNASVIGGLARSLLGAGEIENARLILDAVPDDVAKKPEVARARAALEVASAAPATNVSELETLISAEPDNLELRFELASVLMASGKRDAAADQLLEIIGRDRDWKEGAARQRFLQLLEAEGVGDPWSSAQRRRLSSVLFT